MAGYYQQMPQINTSANTPINPSVYQQPAPQMINSYPNQTSVVNVKTKEEALYYPVGPGNTVIFLKEDNTAIYTKSMQSTIDPPIFMEYIRADVTKEKESNTVDYQNEIDRLWSEINALKETRNQYRKYPNNKRREDSNNRYVRQSAEFDPDERPINE